MTNDISQCLLKYILNGRTNRKKKDHGDDKLGSTKGLRRHFVVEVVALSDKVEGVRVRI
ncbi:hypothetical protein JHK87_049457 [Glycine soja]|nr:hypothetical protein JHK87_049457 [Glycine soja]